MNGYGFMDSFNFEKNVLDNLVYLDSSFFNVFVFGGPKIKSIRILRDIDISHINGQWGPR